MQIKDTVNLVWHAGDVGYADDSFLHVGCATDFCYEDTFDTYMKNVQPWASQLPYMVTPGNHEAGMILLHPNYFFLFSPGEKSLLTCFSSAVIYIIF